MAGGLLVCTLVLPLSVYILLLVVPGYYSGLLSAHWHEPWPSELEFNHMMTRRGRGRPGPGRLTGRLKGHWAVVAPRSSIYDDPPGVSGPPGASVAGPSPSRWQA
jgi:hypothetical protein